MEAATRLPSDHGGRVGPARAEGSAAVKLPAPSPGRLLVVDDESFLRDAVAASLRFLGFEVTTGETGAQALSLTRDQPFDLVVLDVMLPDTDGFEVVRRLRRDGCRVIICIDEMDKIRDSDRAESFLNEIKAIFENGRAHV